MSDKQQDSKKTPKDAAALRKRTEDALQAREKLLSTILATTIDGFWVVDNQKRIIQVNDAYCAMTGYSREELLSMTINDLDAVEVPEETSARIKRIIENGSELFETYHRRKDGTVFPLEISTTYLPEHGGQLVCFCRDITERKRIEEALQKEVVQRQVLVDQSRDGIVVLNHDGSVHEANQRFAEMLQYTPQESLQLHVWDWDAQWTSDQILEMLQQADAEGAQFETRHQRKDGTFLDVEISTNGALIGEQKFVFCVCRDITERKQAEAEIHKLNEELEQRVEARTVQVRAQRDELDTLYTFSTEMRIAKNTEDLFAYTLKETCRLLRADAGIISLFSPVNSSFTIEAATGFFVESIGLSFPADQGLNGQVLQTQKPVTSENYSAEPRALPLKNIDKFGPAALVPLHSEEALIGVLAIARSKESNSLPFTPAEVQTLISLGEIAGNALRRQFLFESAQKRLGQIQTLRNIDMAITGSLDLRVTFNVILDEITGLLKTDAAAILRLEPHTGSLNYEAWRGFNHSNPAELTLRLGEGFAGRAAMNREPIHLPDLREVEADKYQRPLFEQEGFMAYFAVPLIAKGLVQGVLEIFHREPFHSDGEWLEFLEALAGQTAIAIDNAELFHNMERTNFELFQAYDATIEGWAHALDLKDEETEDHSRRVTEMTVAIARQMNITDEELAHVRRGALLHDIGKMGIPDSILLKPGKLNDNEWVIMRKHPVYAYNMLAPIDYLKPALDIPYCHHEKWDGTGYPRGLKGKAIPLAARIFAMVDVYDALTSDRPYRKAWSKEETLSLIREESGKHFDPEVVEAFMSIIENEAT